MVCLTRGICIQHAIQHSKASQQLTSSCIGMLLPLASSLIVCHHVWLHPLLCNKTVMGSCLPMLSGCVCSVVQDAIATILSCTLNVTGIACLPLQSLWLASLLWCTVLCLGNTPALLPALWWPMIRSAATCPCQDSEFCGNSFHLVNLQRSNTAISAVQVHWAIQRLCHIHA